MRIGRIALLTILTLALVGLGFWARHEAMVKDLNAIFAVGLFSPIRAEYPSVVTPEQQVVIQQREQELKLRSETQARWWRVLSIVLFAGAVIPLARISVLVRRALNERHKSKAKPSSEQTKDIDERLF